MTSQEPDADPVSEERPDDGRHAGLVRLALLACIAGVLTGVLGGLFRLVLRWAETGWLQILDWSAGVGSWRVLLPILGAALATGVARAVVRTVPEAAGSGVQLVKAMMVHEAAPPRLRVVPVKFVGATLSMGVGMLLGREGPMVQMGAAIGGEVGHRAGIPPAARRDLAVAMGGAGLGVAFSAPVAGVVFVLEELARSVRTRLVVVTLVGAGAALAAAVPLIGDQPVFLVPRVAPPPVWQLVFYVLLGVVVGWIGAQYNRLILFTMAVNDRIASVAPEIRAAVVGASVGFLGLVSPMFIGGGEALTTVVLAVGLPLSTLLLVLLVRWIMSPVSYSTGVPGGLFAPMLTLGALLGAAAAGTVNAVAPSLHLSVGAFAIVGMSTFFTAVVRAPITGVVLCMEMTATTSLVVPMMLAAAVALVTCTVLKSEPIYTSLLHRST